MRQDGAQRRKTLTLDASVAILSNMSLTNEFIADIAFFDIVKSGCIVFRTRWIYRENISGFSPRLVRFGASSVVVAFGPLALPALAEDRFPMIEGLRVNIAKL
jgi:hypothetical protein